MRQRKTRPESEETPDETPEDAMARVAARLASPMAFGAGTWNTLNSARALPQATLEWTLGDIGDGSIRITVDNPTDQGIDRLAALAERFADLAL